MYIADKFFTIGSWMIFSIQLVSCSALLVRRCYSELVHHLFAVKMSLSLLHFQIVSSSFVSPVFVSSFLTSLLFSSNFCINTLWFDVHFYKFTAAVRNIFLALRRIFVASSIDWWPSIASSTYTESHQSCCWRKFPFDCSQVVLNGSR